MVDLFQNRLLVVDMLLLLQSDHVGDPHLFQSIEGPAGLVPNQEYSTKGSRTCHKKAKGYWFSGVTHKPSKQRASLEHSHPYFGSKPPKGLILCFLKPERFPIKQRFGKRHRLSSFSVQVSGGQSPLPPGRTQTPPVVIHFFPKLSRAKTECKDLGVS